MTVGLLLSFLLCSLVVFSADADTPPSTLTLTAVIRDFSNANSNQPEAHPDFNSYLCGVKYGMIENVLSEDHKPIYVRNNCVYSKESFDQWWTDTPGVNFASQYPLVAHYDTSIDSYVFRDDNFFPIDGNDAVGGFGNDWYSHNFGFTLELNTKFTYESGQIFSFTGDDDIWVFINDKLVIDLGGVHSPLSASVNLDSLSLTVGKEYDLDIYFAERHVDGSSLAFTTNIVLIPEIPPNPTTRAPTVQVVCPEISTATMPSSTCSRLVNFEVVVSGDFKSVVVDYGDGTTGTFSGPSPIRVSHKYDAPGTYTVKTVLDADDSSCESAVTSSEIIVNGAV